MLGRRPVKLMDVVAPSIQTRRDQATAQDFLPRHGVIGILLQLADSTSDQGCRGLHAVHGPEVPQ